MARRRTRALAAAVLALAVATVLAPPAYAALPQDDAGSGTDAGDTAADAREVPAGGPYTGMLEGPAPLDHEDWYAFAPGAGRTGAVRHAGRSCFAVYDPAMRPLGEDCEPIPVIGSVTFTATVEGRHFLRVWSDEPGPYRFSIGVDEAPPDPLVVGDVIGARPGALPDVTPATQAGEHVVVAVVDTGINPYHAFFRAPELTAHPSTWLDGFPPHAVPVHLSLDAPSYEGAVSADAHVWDGIERATYDDDSDAFDAPVYTFPGTRVVAAVSFSEYGGPGDVDPGRPRAVLDDDGHGTHSASLALGAPLSEAPGNVLVVAVEVGSGDFMTGIRWAARQPFVDVVSVSLGRLANAPVTFSPIGFRNGPEWATLEAAASGKPVFVASGNGVSGSGVAPDRCTTYTSPYTGPWWVWRIGAAEPGSDGVKPWHCVPVDAVAPTDVTSAHHRSLTRTAIARGTSAATPNVVAHHAALLLHARAEGIDVDAQALVRYLLASAEPIGPGVHGSWIAAPYPASLAEQGYGLVDERALGTAVRAAGEGGGPPSRPETEEWFERDHELRTALWGPGSLTAGEWPLPGRHTGRTAVAAGR